MKRQDMIDVMRGMGWRPVGNPQYNRWVGVQQHGKQLVYRLRQMNPVWWDDPELMRDHEHPGQADYVSYGVYTPTRWSNLCDDEVLRFYLKIMMEGL